MFNEKQLKALAHQLDASRIKSRSKGNITLSYLEGHDLIETANKIFGYGHWSYAITSLEQVSQEQNQNQNFIIAYKAVVKISVHNANFAVEITREDVGFGTGIAKTLADAHEGGAKEAVTDAIKRSLRSFGNQFGNSLYDKSKNHNQVNRPQTQHYQQLPPQRENQVAQLPQDYSTLTNLGLTVLTQGDRLVVMGEDIFNKRATIKSCGFSWDGVNKVWYKILEEDRAA